VIVLALDASTYVGTVAVFENRRLLAAGETAMRGKDAERLFPLVLDTVREAGRDLRDVGEILCGAGPGSFTSLRIAASLAKGISVGLGSGIRPVPSLGLIVAANAPASGEARYLAVLDALRDEFYAQPFALKGEAVVPLAEAVLTPATHLDSMAREAGLELVGPESGGKWTPHARGAVRLPEAPHVDLAGWEPDYGRKAEAQARWEAAHGRSLSV
jgi:tRNA threonylcarbamoyladenosine biosynthesis protein TsaB